MMPDWSDWPDVWAAQNANVHTDADKYPYPWFLHDNEWTPVVIDWLNHGDGYDGEEYDFEATFTADWVMDVADSDYLWLDQNEGGGEWTDSNKEDTIWEDTNKGNTSWGPHDYPKR